MRSVLVSILFMMSAFAQVDEAPTFHSEEFLKRIIRDSREIFTELQKRKVLDENYVYIDIVANTAGATAVGHGGNTIRKAIAWEDYSHMLRERSISMTALDLKDYLDENKHTNSLLRDKKMAQQYLDDLISAEAKYVSYKEGFDGYENYNRNKFYQDLSDATQKNDLRTRSNQFKGMTYIAIATVVIATNYIIKKGNKDTLVELKEKYKDDELVGVKRPLVELFSDSQILAYYQRRPDIYERAINDYIAMRSLRDLLILKGEIDMEKIEADMVDDRLEKRMTSGI